MYLAQKDLTRMLNTLEFQAKLSQKHPNSPDVAVLGRLRGNGITTKIAVEGLADMSGMCISVNVLNSEVSYHSKRMMCVYRSR